MERISRYYSTPQLGDDMRLELRVNLTYMDKNLEMEAKTDMEEEELLDEDAGASAGQDDNQQKSITLTITFWSIPECRDILLNTVRTPRRFPGAF
ncbi:MAG: hypothetical protein CYPHOPRED_003640 [Cyphobasidiales sp. Tagirdzhanova-0007]|nr:MAG: hypothetical protein CYPHOPRED_003640 [Cyphobasidiales sp. Tagirdzhanova-0007]